MDLHLEKNGFANLFPQSSDLSTPKGFHITDDDKETHAIVRNYVSRPNGVIDDDNDDDPFQVPVIVENICIFLVGGGTPFLQRNLSPF